MNIIPKVNLGQSQFQDTFFVAGAQLTPYRQLRQIELQVREIEGSLKRADINRRRMELKIAKLDPTDQEQALDIEEFQYDLEQQLQLIDDAKARLANFDLMRRQLMERTPKEYWDQGFEQAEVEYHQLYLGKQLAMAKMTGIQDKNVIEQIMLLPSEMQQNVFKIGADMSKPYLLENKSE